MKYSVGVKYNDTTRMFEVWHGSKTSIKATFEYPDDAEEFKEKIIKRQGGRPDPNTDECFRMCLHEHGFDYCDKCMKCDAAILNTWYENNCDYTHDDMPF